MSNGFRGHSKSRFVEEGTRGGGGRVVIEKRTKTNRGGGRPGMCVSSLF